MISHYTAKWGRSKVLLIGYSFGADILPFTINQLSARSRSHIRLVSLLGFAKKADFEVGIGGWLGVELSDAEDTLAEIAKLPPIPLQCVYGAEEDDTGCTAPELDRASKLRMTAAIISTANYKRGRQRDPGCGTAPRGRGLTGRCKYLELLLLEQKGRLPFTIH